jgi:predicted permease
VSHFLFIVWEVIAPIFLLIGVGYLVQKRVGFDLKTLTKLNFWIFVPAFLFVNIFHNELSGRELGKIILHFAIFFSLLGASVWFIAGVMGFQDRLRRAITASVMFYNSGNYGIPVSELAFPGALVPHQVQATIMMMQNVTNFTLGLFIIAGGKGKRRRDTLKEILRLPMIYVLIIAWTMKYFELEPPKPVDVSLNYISKGLVSVAVITLGAQMANLKVPRFNPSLITSLSLRLLFAPFLGYLIIKGLDIRGELAEALLISTSFPTAVNSALLALEFDNEPEFAAAAVFYSTLLSGITVSIVIFVAHRLFM